MSFDKAIEHGKEKRKQYYRICEKVDKSCRCHGGCEYCLGNRMYQKRKQEDKTFSQILDYEMEKIENEM